MSGDAGLDLQVASQQQDIPRIAPLSHSAPNTDSCGVGKARWSISIGDIGEDLTGISTNISMKANDVSSWSPDALRTRDSLESDESPVAPLYGDGLLESVAPKSSDTRASLQSSDIIAACAASEAMLCWMLRVAEPGLSCIPTSFLPDTRTVSVFQVRTRFRYERCCIGPHDTTGGDLDFSGNSEWRGSMKFVYIRRAL